MKRLFLITTVLASACTYGFTPGEGFRPFGEGEDGWEEETGYWQQGDARLEGTVYQSSPESFAANGMAEMYADRWYSEVYVTVQDGDLEGMFVLGSEIDLRGVFTTEGHHTIDPADGIYAQLCGGDPSGDDYYDEGAEDVEIDVNRTPDDRFEVVVTGRAGGERFQTATFQVDADGRLVWSE